MPALFRRRQVWLPTPLGALVLLAAAVLLMGALVFAANPWLAIDAPARGEGGGGARTLIVEGWIDEGALEQAAAAVRRGHYERVLTTGGPLEAWSDYGGWKNYAARAAAYFRAQDLGGVVIIALPAPKAQIDRTYLNALMVREWLRASGVTLDAVDVFSLNVHARRSRMLYRMALGDAVEVGVFAAATDDFDAEHWWRSSAGVKATLGEGLSVAWTACCFWPGAAR